MTQRPALQAAALLADPVKRALHDAVAASDDPVTRERAAAQAGVSANLAGYHLDQLVQAGVLRSSFARRDGRSGPGAGRPAKRYQRTGVEVQLQVPARDDSFLATLLAAAVQADETGATRKALLTAARTAGEQIGEGAAGSFVEALAGRGYEPRQEQDGSLVLRNCPFHHLMPQHLELVCGMNLALLDAVVAGARAPYAAELAPQIGRCCVVLRPDTKATRSRARRVGGRT